MQASVGPMSSCQKQGDLVPALDQLALSYAEPFSPHVNVGPECASRESAVKP